MHEQYLQAERRALRAVVRREQWLRARGASVEVVPARLPDHVLVEARLRKRAHREHRERQPDDRRQRVREQQGGVADPLHVPRGQLQAELLRGTLKFHSKYCVKLDHAR